MSNDAQKPTYIERVRARNQAYIDEADAIFTSHASARLRSDSIAAILVLSFVMVCVVVFMVVTS